LTSRWNVRAGWSTVTGQFGGLGSVHIRWLAAQTRRRLRAARFWQAIGDLDEAARAGYHAQRLLQRLRDTAIMPVTLAADIALTLAEIERDRDDHVASQVHLERSLALLEAAAAAEDRDRLLAQTLITLGDCHRMAGRYPEAGDMLDRALRMVERDGAAPNLHTAALTVLGITAKELGEYDRAAGLYARVRRINQDSGASAADVATLEHNLAGLEYSRGRYPQAEAHARHAVALRRQVPRVAQVDIVADLAVLGSAVARQDRYQEARALFEQALATCRAARPPRQYEIAVHLHNLADIEQAAGRPTDAERLYRQALAIKERLLGPEHPEVGLVANNLGTLLHLQHRPEAADWYRRALAIAERAYPATHLLITRIRRNLDEACAY
jgi:tetratricopeptide (TPR) repeat protein